MQDAGKTVRVDEIDRYPYRLQLGRGFRRSRYARPQHQVGMEGENGLDRRLDQAADTRLLQRCGRIGGVIADRNHIVARSQREDRIGNAGHQADHAMRVVGHRDFASGFIGQHAACLRRDGGRQQVQQQQSPLAGS